MRFPVGVKPFRGQLDVAAFAGVLMLLMLIVLLTSLVHTPGVRLELPVARDLPGTDRPTVAVAVDGSGRYYFRNQIISEADLKGHLRNAVASAPEPLTLLVQMDKTTRHEVLIRLTLLAHEAGIHDALLAVLPAPFSPPAAPVSRP